MTELDFYPAFAQHPCMRTLFRGTFARDEIAREKPETGAYIVNTDRRREPLKHWVLFFVSPEGVITYFDSLGSVPLYAEMCEFIGAAKHFFFNKTRSGQRYQNLRIVLPLRGGSTILRSTSEGRNEKVFLSKPARQRLFNPSACEEGVSCAPLHELL